MTLNEDQDHPHWYQNVEISGLYHHTKSDINQSVDAWIQAKITVFFQWHHIHKVLSFEYYIDKTKWVWILHGWNKMRIRFIKPTSLNSRPNSIQIHLKLWERIGTEVFASSHSCDLESWSRSHRLVSKCTVQNIYHHTEFEPNLFINIWMCANAKLLLCSQ